MVHNLSQWVWLNTAKDRKRPQRKLAPIEINGALYSISNACQDSSKLAHWLQCLFCACLVLTTPWFALSKFLIYKIKIIALLLLLPRPSTVKLGPTDVPSTNALRQGSVAGKKLGSHRRPGADSMMKQNKKRKVWMCSCVWHCTNNEKITKKLKTKQKIKKKQNYWKKYCQNYDEDN